MPKTSNIQISYDLYLDLVQYFFDSQNRTPEREGRIRDALEQKAQAMSRRAVYTQYKTAETETEREQARQKYLEQANIAPEFRH